MLLQVNCFFSRPAGASEGKAAVGCAAICENTCDISVMISCEVLCELYQATESREEIATACILVSQGRGSMYVIQRIFKIR